MVQQLANAKAKTNLRSSVIVWDTDFCCPRGYYFSNTISSKVQTQELRAKKSFTEKSKTKDPKPALLRNNVVEPLK